MIDIEELRINNRVHVDGHEDFFRVTHIEYSMIGVAGGPHFRVETNLVNPIPLTREILIQCRFDFSGLYCVKDQVYIYQWGDSNFYEFNYTKVEIKFLHQLQNLYFALTNKELEIDL